MHEGSFINLVHDDYFSNDQYFLDLMYNVYFMDIMHGGYLVVHLIKALYDNKTCLIFTACARKPLCQLE